MRTYEETLDSMSVVFEICINNKSSLKIEKFTGNDSRTKYYEEHIDFWEPQFYFEKTMVSFIFEKSLKEIDDDL